MSSKIKVRIDYLKGISKELASRVSELEALNPRFKTEIEAIKTEWDGVASETYAGLMEQQYNKCVETVKVLTAFKKYLDLVVKDMKEIDKKWYNKLNPFMYLFGGSVLDKSISNDIFIDIVALNGSAEAAKRANNAIDEAITFFKKVKSHGDWTCKEKDQIDDYIEEIKNEAKKLKETTADYLNTLQGMTNDFNEMERSLLNEGGMLDGAVSKVVSTGIEAINALPKESITANTIEGVKPAVVASGGGVVAYTVNALNEAIRVASLSALLKTLAQGMEEIVKEAASYKTGVDTIVDKGYTEKPVEGHIRYVSQITSNDNYHSEYWGSHSPNAGCKLCSTSMALSWFGIDMSPDKQWEYGLASGGNNGAFSGDIATKINSFGGTQINSVSMNEDPTTLDYVNNAVDRFIKDPQHYTPVVVGYNYYKSDGSIGNHYVTITGRDANGRFTYEDSAPGTPSILDNLNRINDHLQWQKA